MDKLTFEKAKKLYNAGFPFKSVGEIIQTPEVITEDTKSVEIKESVRYPTLSELIETVGKEYRGIGFDGTTHFARSKNGIVTKGQTPSEAVANLWLALNKS